MGAPSELAEFPAIPSISGDPERRPAMREAAEWVAAKLSFANGRVVATDGHPVVLGEWLGAPGKPTILVYGHYDVQPPGDEAEWTTRHAYHLFVLRARVALELAKDRGRAALDLEAAGQDALALAAALHARFHRVPDPQDALADASLFESVHAIVRGNPDRAAAALAATGSAASTPPPLTALRTASSTSGSELGWPKPSVSTPIRMPSAPRARAAT